MRLPPGKLFACTLLSALAAWPAYAAPPATTYGDEAVSAYFRLLIGLCLVLGLILVFYALFRKRFTLLGNRGNGAIEVLEIRPLMPKKSLCLVQVSGQRYLLGVGNDTITLLAALDARDDRPFSEILAHSQTTQSP